MILFTVTITNHSNEQRLNSKESIERPKAAFIKFEEVELVRWGH